MDQQPSSQTITLEQRQRIADALKNSPSQLTLVLARQLGVPEVEVIRSMGADHAAKLDIPL